MTAQLRNWRLFLVHVVSSGLSVIFTILVLPGFWFERWVWGELLLVAVVAGVLNATVKPLLQFFALRYLIASYGTAVVLVNAAVLFLLAVILHGDIAFRGVFALLVGGLVVGILGMVLDALLGTGAPILDNANGAPVRTRTAGPRSSRTGHTVSGSGLQTINESLRLRHVYSTLVDFGASGVVDHTPLGGTRRALQRWIYRVPDPIPALSAPVRTRVLIEQLGPTYVKLGQIVSSQAAVLPDPWRQQLDLLQNEVPPAPYQDIRGVIVTELGAPPEDLFASFSEQPLAAASLAQVHRAVLHDGTEVAVKVQRPNLQSQVRADLGIARLYGKYAERRSKWARQVGVASMLEEFSSTLLEELDYDIEAYNMQRLAKNLDGIDGVRIAKLYPELSTPRVLTQEFVKGVKISDVDAMRSAGLDVTAIGDAALHAAMKMLLIDGFFHADPHPGNLYVDLDTGDVTFLDCGMVGELSVAKRAHLVALLWAFTRDDMAGMGAQLRALSVPFREIKTDTFAQDFERKMSRYPKGAHADVQRVLSAATGVLRDNGLRLDPQLTLALKAMAQASAFFIPLAPAGRPFSTAALESVKDLAKDTFTEEYVLEVGKKEASKVLAKVLQEAPDYLRGLLSVSEQLKRGKISLYLDTSSLDRQIGRLRAISVVIVLALLLAGALIGSSIATGVLSQPGSGNPVAAQWAQYAFFGSVILSAVLILVFLTRMISDTRRERRQGRERE